MKTQYRVSSQFTFAILILNLLLADTLYSQPEDTLQQHFSIYQCDSLIQANADNPDFVILDVRTASEYLPQHLEGAINRDYFASNFSQQINTLPKHKLYLIHCSAGSRSGQTYNLMVTFGFHHIVNMVGGINAWIAALLPTTSQFAPRLAAVSDTLIGLDTVGIGYIDTISLTITNRANEILRFHSLLPLPGTEFSTDFDTTTELNGAADYTFSIYYSPLDQIVDTLDFIIASNGGTIGFHLLRTGVSTVDIREISLPLVLGAYPNPFQESILIEWEQTTTAKVEMIILNQLGQVIEFKNLGELQPGKQWYKWQACGEPTGLYFINLRSAPQKASLTVIRN